MNASHLRVGVIGLGVGEQHAQAYAAYPGSEVVAICDLLSERLEAVSEDFPGVRTTTEAAQLLDDPEIDVVSIASYDDMHYEQVKRALVNGKHVFVEKPICLLEDQARELWRLLGERPHLRLSSNLPLRLSPRFRELRDMIVGGRLGEIYYLEGDYDYGRLHKITGGWRGDLDFYSVVLGGGVHIVDLLLWLTGQRVTEVIARGNAIASRGTKFRFKDLVVATLTFESGLIAKLCANFGCVHPHFHGLRIFGTDGTFINALGDASLYLREDGEIRHRPVTSTYPGIAKGDLIASFLDSIINGGEPEVTAQQAFDALAVCFAVERAISETGPVAVKPFV